MHRRLGERGIKEMRKHLAWYSRGIPGAAGFRSELQGVVDLPSFRTVVERFF
jgi:tRNA-dihydrouridine synthase B